MSPAEKEQMTRIEAKLDILLSIFGKGEDKPQIETPAKIQADVDAVVLRFIQREKKRLKNNG